MSGITLPPYLKPVVEGTTVPIIQQILSDDLPLRIQGFSVVLFLEKRDGTSIVTTGKVSNLDDGTDPNKGKVRFSPASGDLVALDSDYFWRWQITDGSGKVAFCPSEEVARLRVYPVGRN